MGLNTVNLKEMLLSNQYLKRMKSGATMFFGMELRSNLLVLTPVSLLFKKPACCSGRNTGFGVGQCSSATCFPVPSGS